MKNSVLDRLESYFDEYFLDATRPIARNLFLIVVSILVLDIFRSVRFAHRHVLSKLSDTSLNAYHYALKTDRLGHGSWSGVTLSKALRVVPGQLWLHSRCSFPLTTPWWKRKGRNSNSAQGFLTMPHIMVPIIWTDIVW